MLPKPQKLISIVLAFLMLLTAFPPVSFAADPPTSADQIAAQGETRYYDETGTEVTGSPVLGRDAAVSVAKTIEGTDVENEFIVNLEVKTPVVISDVNMLSGAAVVLVLDISGSMSSAMASLKTAACSFLDSYAAEANGAVRYAALVTFDTDARVYGGWKDVTNSTNLSTMKKAIQGLSSTGATFMQGGLMLARNLLRTDIFPSETIANRSVILFSDGGPTRWITSIPYAGERPVTSTNGSGLVREEAKSYTVDMAQAVKDESSIAAGAYDKYTANLYTISYGEAGPAEWLEENIATDSSYSFSALEPEGLNDAFQSIADRIASWAQAWTVTDPMGENIELISDVTQDGIGLEDGTITWDLKQASPSLDDGICTYGYSYRIRLDTTGGTFVQGTSYPTNGETSLTYVMVENGEITSNVITAAFSVPEVEGKPENPIVPTKEVVSDAGKDGATVQVGDQITYEIGYANYDSAPAAIVIRDSLPIGVTFKSATEGGMENGGVVTWKLVDVAAGTGGTVQVVVEVNASAVTKIKNTATVKVGDNAANITNTAENLVGYAVTYEPNGGIGIMSDTNSPYAADATVTILTNQFTRSGYVFTGFKIQGDIFGTVYASAADGITGASGSFNITQNTVLAAQWEANNGGGGGTTTYTVTYNANGGTGSHQDTGLASGSKDAVKGRSDTGISRDGYNFKGWNTSADGTGTVYVAGNALTITGDVTLYAQWRENPGAGDKTYTVFYDPNGGPGTQYSVTETVGDAHTVLANSGAELGFTQLGYVFRGWSTTPDADAASHFGTGREAVGGTAAAGDVIMLYAVWSKLSSVRDSGTDIDTTLGQLDRENHFAHIIGFPDGTVGPEKNITRAEVATIFLRLLTQESRAEIWSKTSSFTDVENNRWYNNAISTLENGNILKGCPDGSFRPNSDITRAELASIAVRFATAEDISGATGMAAYSDISGHWAESDIALAGALGYVSGYADGTFHPDMPITRAEVATFLNNVLNRQVACEDAMLAEMIVWPDNIPGEWYYCAMQEATNSHDYIRDDAGVNEMWRILLNAPNWVALENPASKPEDISF